ncbi:MAG: DUF1254 domain-containing protein, partial [Myxococcales bacterium]
MKCRAALVSLAVVALLAACTKNEVAPGAESGQEPAVTPDEAQLIAEQAYVYAYPMMENYRTMYVQAIDRTAPGYLAPFNELVHKTELLGPDFKDIVRPNNDTVYSMGWIDLRAQPLVITVPQIEDRYFSVQLIDMFTHNFAYMGTRATNGESGSYLVAGPQWKGTKPGDTKAVYRSESNFVYCIVRVEVRGPHDLEAANAIQRGFRLTPLHVFLSRSRAPVAAGITFPMYDPDKARSSGFIDLFNFLLEQVVIVPEEQELMQRFARIGIQPGHRAASLAFDLATRDAIDEGIGEALKRVSSNATDPSGLDGVV